MQKWRMTNQYNPRYITLSSFFEILASIYITLMDEYNS